MIAAVEGVTMHFLREGTQHDAIQVEALVRRSAVLAYRDIFPPEAPMPGVSEALAEWRFTLSAEDEDIERRRTIVAEDHGVILGVVVIIIRASDLRSGHLHRLYVDPLVWGQGIGTSLYLAAVHYLLEKRCTHATLWTLEKNIRARQWYERNGWKLTGERIPVYPEGGVYDFVYSIDLKTAFSP